MTIQLRRLAPREFSLIAPQLVDIYLTAMDYPRDMFDRRLHGWRVDSLQPGFTAVIAESEAGPVGVAYGFLGHSDTWWDKQLQRGFALAGGPTAEQVAMLRNYFELAEIHVHPSMQGKGLGRHLLDALAWNLPASNILLSTPEVPGEANGAFGLYRSAGFFDVLRNYYYPGDPRPFAILGARLPLSPGKV